MSSFSLFSTETRSRSAGRERRVEINRMKKCLRQTECRLSAAGGGGGARWWRRRAETVMAARRRSVTERYEPSQRRGGGGGGGERKELEEERSCLSDMLRLHLEVFVVVKDVGSLRPAPLFRGLLSNR
ncbi:uncharacterized protein V6R79_025544 [Siganus canaliculatus]